MVRSPFDKIAFLYDFIETHILKDYQGSFELISEYLPMDNTGKLIDIGGGTGYFSEMLINNVSAAIVIDDSKKMIRKVNHTKLSPLQADARSIGIKGQQFDLALIINVLHHVKTEDQKPIISEVYRILKPGGQAFIIEVFSQSFFNILFTKFDDLIFGKTFPILPDTLKAYLENEGFSSIDLFFPKKHNWKYVMIGRK